MNTFVIATEVTLVSHDCGECGVTFGMTERFKNERLRDHRSFSCPNGHSRIFTGKPTAEQRAERLEQQLASREEDLRAERASHSATKGALTKVRKRAINAVCPCCNRSFANVSRHMTSKHPEQVAASSSVAAGSRPVQGRDENAH